MRNITLEELLEAGCHFGHQVTRQNPKARDFVFEARDNIHIIDLEKTKEGLDEAMVFVKDLATKGGTMIVLGAKRQAQPIVKEEVERANKEDADGLYYVTNRWIGGILTNFSEITKNFKRLKELDKNLASKETRSKFTKKEISLWDKERSKLGSFYGGIANMEKAPDALFIIDTHLENLAVREALATHVKTVGITDTNADPTLINYPIPANDDAVGSIKLITSAVIDAWIEGRKAFKKASKTEVAGEKAAPVAEKKEVEAPKTEKTEEAKKPVKKAAKTEVKKPTKKDK